MGIKYWKPGQQDSIVDLASASTLDPLNKSDVGTEQRLMNSGYVKYDDSASKTSSIPAITDKSMVQSPEKENNDAILSAQNSANSLKQMLSSTSDQVKSIYGDILKTADDSMGYNADYLEKLKAREAEVARLNAGQFSSEEQARIDAAKKNTGDRFDVVIGQAKEKARQGRASNLVAAAKSGGLDASGWAGISALVGEKAGGAGGFEGVGGKLAAMGSEYDAVISDLEVKKNQAIAAAEAAERQAIIGGSADAWKQVTELYSQAKSYWDDQATMLQNKQGVLNSYSDFLKQGMLEVQDTVKRMAESGIDISSLTSDEIATLEKEAGFEPGTLESQYNAYLSEYIQKQEEAALKTGKTLFDMAKDLPEGKEYQIPGTEITLKGIKTVNPSVSEFDMTVGGKVFKVGIDKKTGEELWRIDTGKTSGGSGGGTKSTTKFPEDFSYWYETTFGEKPTKGNQDAEDEYTRWKGEGGASGAKKRAETANNPGGYTDSELRKLRSAGIDQKDIKAADKYLYNKETVKKEEASTGSVFDDLIAQRLQERNK